MNAFGLRIKNEFFKRDIFKRIRNKRKNVKENNSTDNTDDQTDRSNVNLIDNEKEKENEDEVYF